VAAVVWSATARAEGPQAQATSAPVAASKGHGLAVLAAPGAEAATWPLAKEVYARDPLRPAVDEARARVIAGEAAPPALRDLSEERAGVHGDDAASRAVLKTIATQLGVRAIVVVFPGEPVSARVFLADAGAFDAARYAPEPADAASDGGVSSLRWTGTVTSLDRAYAEPASAPAAPASPASPMPSGEPAHAPPLATSETPPAPKPKNEESKPFYASPWFWGAVGAAAFGGTAVYFATRDNSPSTIHLQLQVR
jgi:hypothetical protein